MPTLVNLEPGIKLKSTKINLYGRTGIRYTNLALDVPGYGSVPCSKALCNDFTNESGKLMLVITDPDDVYKPTTSDIWITHSNVVQTVYL